METNFRNTPIEKIQSATIVSENKLLRSAFAWMAVAMVLTTISSLLFAFVPQLTSLLLEPTEFGFKPTILAYVVMFAPLLFVLAMSFGINKMNYFNLSRRICGLCHY